MCPLAVVYVLGGFALGGLLTLISFDVLNLRRVAPPGEDEDDGSGP